MKSINNKVGTYGQVEDYCNCDVPNVKECITVWYTLKMYPKVSKCTSQIITKLLNNLQLVDIFPLCLKVE